LHRQENPQPKKIPLSLDNPLSALHQLTEIINEKVDAGSLGF